MSAGLELAASVVAGTLAGLWLDGRLATSPWLFIAGCVLGSGVGIKRLISTIRRGEAEERGHHERDGER